MLSLSVTASQNKGERGPDLSKADAVWLWRGYCSMYDVKRSWCVFIFLFFGEVICLFVLFEILWSF